MTNYKLDQAIKENDASAVRAILKRKPKEKSYAVYLAAQLGQAKLVDLLLNELKADPNSQFEGQSALVEAVHKEQLDCLELLLEAGADPNTRYKFGPILCKAAHRGLMKDGEAVMVKLLVQHGADTSLTNTFNETALDIAAVRFRNNPERLQAVQAALATPPLQAHAVPKTQPLILLNKDLVNGAIAALPVEFTIEQLAAVLQCDKGLIDLPPKTNTFWPLGTSSPKYADAEIQRVID